MVAVLAHVAEGIGTRKTARLVGVHKDTVTRYIHRAGQHAEQLHDTRTDALHYFQHSGYAKQ